ncbi:hypothetical protein A1O1_03387 [Capronia coronata CBS 617.96]|uniref:Dihydroorotate dehydrogenase (quinone), mitochondrial n=1 Tax=Capronia coronata CBS 617.96 TaxID=1182541 RepID=W9YCP2_9EURO|nr:uncharacterized protein A1O1_03387 [Capronia coronata CBS 617.96]EXJ90288.1 hypothetical protein A1O1_03387 [Capronia coronata CBS 617.96]
MKQIPSRLLWRAARPRLQPSLLLGRPPFASITARRYASTTDRPSTWGSRIINVCYGATLALGLGIVYLYVTDTRASAHRYIVIPALRFIYKDPEEAHHAGNQALETLWDLGLYPRERADLDQKGDLEVEVFGRILKNPVATSAGIDKHADIPDALFAIGPAIVEIGGTTPLPQAGNPKPRVFRLPSQEAMINRYGLNSEGADHVASRLRTRVRKFAYSLGLGSDEVAEKAVLDGIAGVPPGSLVPGKMLAINIAKNKVTPEDDVEAVTKDYVYCVEKLGPYADILVVNVSSPNTPGLRSLQQADKLQTILSGVVKAAHAVDRRTRPAVMVKVSPDEDSEAQIAGICDAVWAAGVDGVIVGNTTNRRPQALPHLPEWSPLEKQHLLETGGFSGPHLFDRTVALVKKYKKLLAEQPAQVTPVERQKGAVEAETEKIKAELAASSESPSTPEPDAVTTSIDTGVIPVVPVPEISSSEQQPLIELPQERLYDNPQSEEDTPDSSSQSDEGPAIESPEETAQLEGIKEALDRLPPKAQRDAMDQLGTEIHLPPSDSPKVIFATGGITNGKQALEVLNAGANVAMVYTALVYGGVGTITRMKDEMRAEMTRQAEERRSEVQK